MRLHQFRPTTARALTRPARVLTLVLLALLALAPLALPQGRVTLRAGDPPAGALAPLHAAPVAAHLPARSRVRGRTPRHPAPGATLALRELRRLIAHPSRSQTRVALLIGADFPAAQVRRAVAVAACESTLVSRRGPRNPDGTYDWGVFQLNDGGTLQHLGGTPAMALNPAWSVPAAYRLYRERGWQPWTCARR